eukprot:CAMPEP_0205956886 /NCGR_PEP_ID=MMETSP1459-20131121/40941_1 /ASSEMBLY_ACC=CAM_ASM_001120 /TAXON_ID=41880 /ORGANISM="Pycnococcus provasolii, Strain RCC931" /LENGTH=37 /DNA_ID= /DNA_START= /DNA_END= /DNA_ORIENTATION=
MVPLEPVSSGDASKHAHISSSLAWSPGASPHRPKLAH